jgi:hypothetical protein
MRRTSTPDAGRAVLEPFVAVPLGWLNSIGLGRPVNVRGSPLVTPSKTCVPESRSVLSPDLGILGYGQIRNSTD